MPLALLFARTNSPPHMRIIPEISDALKDASPPMAPMDEFATADGRKAVKTSFKGANAVMNAGLLRLFAQAMHA